MIQGTLIEGLNATNVQAVVNAVDVRPFTYTRHFPIKRVNTFAWKTLAGQRNAKNVAADVSADNSSTLRKRRPIFESATGELPKLAISREMRRSEIKEYQVALALAGTTDARELVQFWGDDVEFCFLGVQAQIEYIAWAAASNAGKLAFTSENNAAVATEFDLDYQVDPEQKITTSVAFSDVAKADVLKAFADAVKAGKTAGSNIKYAFTSLNNFYNIASAEQVIKASASFANNALGIPQTPDLATVNSMLARQAWLNGVQLIIIDQTITRELADGTQKTQNVFADDRIIFSESPVLGSTQYDILRDNSQVVLRAERAHTVVKKYSHPEPLTEVTLAEADALPVLDSAYKNIYLRTDAQSW